MQRSVREQILFAMIKDKFEWFWWGQVRKIEWDNNVRRLPNPFTYLKLTGEGFEVDCRLNRNFTERFLDGKKDLDGFTEMPPFISKKSFIGVRLQEKDHNYKKAS